MSDLVKVFGSKIDLGPCVFGPNLNLFAARGCAKLEVLAVISGPDVFDDVDNPQGTQRDLEQKHAKEAYAYGRASRTEDPKETPKSFPEIILNVRDTTVIEIYDRETGEILNLSSFSSAADCPKGVVGVRIRLESALKHPVDPTAPQISRVDGNHRLSGVLQEQVLNGELKPEDQLGVPFSLFVGLDRAQESALFRDINGNHKGMDSSHIIAIGVRLNEGEVKVKDPHKWIAHHLSQKGRAFENLVDRGGSTIGSKRTQGKVPPVSLTTLSATVKATMDSLVDEMPGLEADDYLDLLDNYWHAVREVFPEAWADKKKYILLQSIGLTGFARLGANLMKRSLSGPGAAAPTRETYIPYLRASQVEVNLEKSDPTWSGVAGASGGKLVGDILIKASTNTAAKIATLRAARKPKDDSGSALDLSVEAADKE